MSRRELVERFDLDRVVPSPATFDYKKLDWMNGVYLRNLQPDEYAHCLCKWLDERGIDWPRDLVHATVPLVEEKIETFAQYPDFVRFLFEDVAAGRRRPADLPRSVRTSRERRAVGGHRARGGAARARRRAGREAADAFQPIRLAITGSKVSPGLFESMELLGKEKSLARLAPRYGAER